MGSSNSCAAEKLSASYSWAHPRCTLQLQTQNFPCPLPLDLQIVVACVLLHKQIPYHFVVQYIFACKLQWYQRSEFFLFPSIKHNCSLRFFHFLLYPLFNNFSKLEYNLLEISNTINGIMTRERQQFWVMNMTEWIPKHYYYSKICVHSLFSFISDHSRWMVVHSQRNITLTFLFF